MSEARTSEAPTSATSEPAAMPSPTPKTAPASTTPEPTSVLGEAPPPAPEPYNADTLTVPDGFDKTGDGFKKFSEIMNSEASPQKRAQELVDLYATAVTAELNRQVEVWHRQQGDWQREIQADPELGGSKLDGVKQIVSRVLDNPELSDPKFREALVFTGAGNNPAVVRTLYRWAKALSEGSAVVGGPAERNRDGSINGERPTIAQAIYGPEGPHSGGPRLS